MSFTLSKLGAEITVPDFTIKGAAVRSYPITDSRFDSAMEHEFEFRTVPERFTYDIPVGVKDAVFYRQPPLTEEFREEDCKLWTPTHIIMKNGFECTRPLDIVDSLAVYHSYKRGNEAKTGKILHIPRPKITDKLGVVGWGKISYVEGNLVVTLPEEYMKNAEYPVVVDPTFGYTDIGESSNTDQTGFVGAQLATLSENGTITAISMYLSGGAGSSGKLALYDDSGGEPDVRLDIGTIASITSDAWNNASVNYAAVAANYNLAWGEFSNPSVVTTYYDSGGDMSYKFSATLLNPWGGNDGSIDRIYSIYATYTAAGGGISVPVAMNQYGTHINKKVRGG